MESPLEPIRHERAEAVLFYQKPHSPFKTAPLPVGAPKNKFVDVLLLKNVQERGNFRKAASDAQVQLNFGDNYRFWKNFWCVEEQYPTYSPFKEQSKFLGEVAFSSGSQETIKDVRKLSNDVYKLSSQQEMFNQFMQENLI